MQTKEQVLQACTIEGNVVKLPNVQLERNLYQDVAKALQLIGGKWKGGKVFGFVFSSDPTELLNEIANGGKRNLKKEFQFFATPDDLADELVDLAWIEANSCILEPSAGQGAIVNAITRKFPKKQVDCYELMPINQTILKKIPEVVFIADDFMACNSEKNYDAIIANPPFSNNQDIDHVRKMYSKLKHYGRLVAITSLHWQLSSNRKETEFRNWLDKVGAKIIPIENGRFKKSGTMVAGNIIVITR